MLRLQQIVQSTLVRVTAFFWVIFRSVFGFLGNIFGSVGKTLVPLAFVISNK